MAESNLQSASYEIKRSPDMNSAQVCIAEEQFAYPYSEYLRWKDPADLTTRKALIRSAGAIGRPLDFDRNQLDQHYPEVKYAIHLIELGFPRSGIYYENFHITGQSRATTIVSEGTYAAGTRTVQNILSDEFLTVLAHLYDLNKDQMTSSKGRSTPLDNIGVDLCVIDIEKPRFGLVEVKKCNWGNRKPEPVATHQRFILAASTYLFHSLGTNAFRNHAEVEWFCKFVVFVPENNDVEVPLLRKQFSLRIR